MYSTTQLILWVLLPVLTAFDNKGYHSVFLTSDSLMPPNFVFKLKLKLTLHLAPVITEVTPNVS